MENMRRRGIAERNYSQQAIYEDFQPSSDWTHDSNSHVLLIDVPGFMKEEVKVEVDNFGSLTVTGERRMSENKHRRFKQVFVAPEDSDFDKISGKLDGGLLFVIIPKKENEIEEEKLLTANETKEDKELEKLTNDENRKKNDNDDDADKHEAHVDMKEESYQTKGGEEETKDERSKGNLSKDSDWVEEKERLEILMETVMEKISKNKTVVVSVVVALSFGLYLSHKFRSTD